MPSGAHAEVEGAIVDLSDGFEVLRKRLEELCRTLPEQEEVDQVWSSIHKMEVRANEQAMKTMTLEGKLKQWQQEYDPRRYISEEFEFENGKMGAEEEEEEEAQEEEEEGEEGSGDSLSDYGDVVGMLELIESDFARAEATAKKENGRGSRRDACIRPYDDCFRQRHDIRDHVRHAGRSARASG